MHDGCSILSNVGTRRFRVVSRGERDGYDTAQVKYIVDDPIPHHQLPGTLWRVLIKVGTTSISSQTNIQQMNIIIVPLGKCSPCDNCT